MTYAERAEARDRKLVEVDREVVLYPFQDLPPACPVCGQSLPVLGKNGRKKRADTRYHPRCKNLLVRRMRKGVKVPARGEG